MLVWTTFWTDEVESKNSNMGTGQRTMSFQAMQALYDLRQKNQLCDATIRMDDGVVFFVHRAILSSCSEYFRAIFTTSLHSREETDVYLPGIDSETMRYIVDYAYLRQVTITAYNVSKLLLAADYLCIAGIHKMCCQYYKDNLTPINCLLVLRFARDHFCKGLEDSVFQYILHNFTEISKYCTDILLLSYEDLVAITSSDVLNVKSEEIVWETILAWLNYDVENRKQYVVNLLKCVRHGLLETQYFLERVKDHPLVTSNDSCRPIIIDTLKFLYDLETIQEANGEVLTPEVARPRIPHEILFAIGGWSGGSPTNAIESYDTRADRWIVVPEVDPVGPRAYHGLAVIGYNIYVIGGFDGMDYFNSCRRFNAVNKVWAEVAPMNARRCYVSVAVLRDVIYAMGGYDGHHRQNSAEKYNYTTNQWSLIQPMHCQRSDASATTLDDRIYITGGFNGQECMNTAEVYDPTFNQWTMITPMRSRRSGVSCIAYHGQIYVIGGFNGLARMCSGERYSPVTNAWSPIPDMYNPRSNFAIEVIDDMIFAIGGFNGVTTIFHVECYDERTNEWYEATDMNVFRSALSACVISNLPNMQDYVHKHRERLMEEKRLKMLAINAQRAEPHNGTVNPGFIGPVVVHNFPNNIIDINNNNIDLAVQQLQLQPPPENEEDAEPEMDHPAAMVDDNNNDLGPLQVLVDMQLEAVRDANMQVDNADEDAADNQTDENQL